MKTLLGDKHRESLPKSIYCNYQQYIRFGAET